MYILLKNPISNKIDTIMRLSDNTFIPMVDDNTDYQAYLAWCAEGNTPLPADGDQI